MYKSRAAILSEFRTLALAMFSKEGKPKKLHYAWRAIAGQREPVPM